MHDLIRLGQTEPVRKPLAEATQGLLGCTIALSEAEWHEPSLLPGWTRAHVATHLARQADAMREVILVTPRGEARTLYASREARVQAIEDGADRDGLAIQIDLDQSAGALYEAFDSVTDWSTTVRLPMGTMPLAALTIARLFEVSMHHVDLLRGFSPTDVDPVPARWLLEWAVDRCLSYPDAPSVALTSDSGVTASFGSGERAVTGTDAALWGWLTGRSDGASVQGAEGITWPLMA